MVVLTLQSSRLGGRLSWQVATATASATKYLLELNGSP